MAEEKLTAAQRAVIAHRGGTLLVSAAAGSGKTKVLVDRLMRLICDENDPHDLSEFLIITYTKAAAAELRVKIAKRIGELLASGGNAHLRRQLSQLYLANISTVHAFCGEILRTYSYLTDVPPDFRIAEEQECEPLMQKALERALEEACAETSGPIPAFFTSLGDERTDSNTCSMILALYDRAQCHLYPEKWLNACADAVTCEYSSVDETPWGAQLIASFRKEIARLSDQMRAAKAIIAENEPLAPYAPAFADDLFLLDRLAAAPDWDAIYALHNVTFTGLSGVSNQCSCLDEKAKVQRIRNNYKDALKAQCAIFSISAAQALADLRSTGSALAGLCALTQLFEKYYSRLKRARRVLDFQDLEHCAISLLLDGQGRPTAAARELSDRFCEIMVDEYQDTNEAQDAIFRAVSKNGENLFFVGDVKQSIYRFRHADPSIFLRKYNTFTETEDEAFFGGRKILLSANFRSCDPILDAVNHVFKTCMSEEVGELAYGEAEALAHGRNVFEPDFPAVQLHVIDTKNGAASDVKEEAEAHFVARQIRQLLASGTQIPDDKGNLRPIREEDIAILMGTVKTAAPVFAHVLAQYGIHTVTDRDSNIFDTTEVATLYAMLEIINNPHQDVHLVTAMASPVCGFTADELAQMRACDRNCDLFDALVRCAEQSEKHKAFLELLAELREKRTWMRIPELIDTVCRTLDFFALFGAMGNGAGRVRNLRKFCELPLSAQTGGDTELGAFLRYVARLKASENGVSSGADGSGSAVRIMSIHKSKGLEYPVVFLSNLSHGLKSKSLDYPVLADTDLYLGCRVTDHELMARYPSIARLAIRESLRRDMISEQLRVLYVGMTRAKNALIMTYCAFGAAGKLNKIADKASYPAAPFVSGNVACSGDWVLLAAALRPEGKDYFGGAEHVSGLPGKPWLIRFHNSSEFMQDTEASHVTASVMPKTDPICLERAYPFAASAQLPAKLTATQLKGGTLEPESVQDALQFPRRRPPVVPARPFGVHEQTSAERGTAIHRFLQFCSYDKCDSQASLAQEAQRLTEAAFLTPEQAAAADYEKLARFFASDLGKRVRSAEARREFKFSLLADAKTFLPNAAEEQLMLQGVVDCFWFEDGGITILDYKTDRIRPGGEAERAEEYRAQLDAYKYALERIWKQPVKRRILYFFETETAFEL